MAANKDLSRFVRDALSAGRNRDEISTVLSEAGWTKAEASEALEAWSEANFTPPVPRPQTMVTARDFFIYALTFGVLIFAASYLIILCHQLIDVAFEGSEKPRILRNIRWSIAVLVVAAPTYFWLTWRERRKLSDDPSLYRSSVRKWLIYITLLVAATVLLGDLTATIYALLQGDFTLQFVAKAAVVAAVAGGIFLYYLNDIRRGETL